MISIYLQPDYTQIVRGRLKKNKELEILEAAELNASYLATLEHLDKFSSVEEAAADLAFLFADIKENFNVRRDEVYLVLPDYLFTVVDCFQLMFQQQSDNLSAHDREQARQQLEQQIMDAAQMQIDELYYSVPIRTSPAPQETWGTVYAIEKRIIDIFIRAADMENIRLFSIEAASMAFLRGTGKFSKEEFIYMGFQEQATLIGYSSIGGMFKMDVPELSMSHLASMSTAAANAQINSFIVQFDGTAEMTFSFMNQDVPFAMLGSDTLLKSFPAFTTRAAAPQQFPSYVISDLEPGQQQKWMCAVGTLLQDMDYTADEFMDVIDSYERILSGNVLPRDIQYSTRAYQMLARIKRVCRVAVAAMGLLLAVECVGIIGLSGVTVPPDLQKDYKAAQQSMKDLESEIKLIEAEQQEHQYPMEAMQALLQARPQNLSFISVRIGGDNSKEADKRWVSLKTAAADPLVFQQYLSELSGNEMFSGIAMPQMNANEKGSMLAEFLLGKGKVGK